MAEKSGLSRGSDNPSRKPSRGNSRNGKFTKGILLWVTLILAVVIVSTSRKPWTAKTKRIDISEFERLLQKDRIVKISFTENKAKGELVDGYDYKYFTVLFPDRYLDRQKYDEIRSKVDVFEAEERNDLWISLLVNLVPWVLLLGLFYFLFFRQMRAPGGPGGVLSFGKSRAKLASKEHTGITFDDVAGIEEAKEEVKEIVEFLKSPERFERIGGRIPRGVMLVGPPGAGKTLLAKAIAGEADVPFFNICGSDFVELFVGVGASRVRDMFRQAKENSPCIIFLDEVDAVGRRRGTGLGGGHDEREQTLNAILVEMDGFERDQGIIVIAATNRPDVLDPALLRPGRFDREIVIDLPDIKGREAILKVHARKVKLAADVDLSILARGTPMFSGADLEAIINEAAIMATLQDKEAIEMEDLEEARDKVRWGKQKRSRVMSEQDKRITAYHESGHAIIAKALPAVEPLHKVTIIPRGMALGSTMSLPERDKYHMTRAELLGNVTFALGGRVAEEVFCEDITSGAQNDLEQATNLVRLMVCKWGMSDEIGPISYSEGEEHLFLGREITRTKSHSEAVAVEIDREIKRIINTCYQQAKDIIHEREKETARIAEALLKYESLDAKEVDLVMAGEDIGEARKENSRRHGPTTGDTDEKTGKGEPIRAQ